MRSAAARRPAAKVSTSAAPSRRNAAQRRKSAASRKSAKRNASRKSKRAEWPVERGVSAGADRPIADTLRSASLKNNFILIVIAESRNET
jgi:hypothetical protein